MANNKSKHLWHIEGGMKEGRRLDVPIHSSPFYVGRDQSCHLTVTAPGVSRKHLQLEIEDNQLFVSDLGSTNGTFVNRTSRNQIRRCGSCGTRRTQSYQTGRSH